MALTCEECGERVTEAASVLPAVDIAKYGEATIIEVICECGAESHLVGPAIPWQLAPRSKGAA